MNRKLKTAAKYGAVFGLGMIFMYVLLYIHVAISFTEAIEKTTR